jgi:hypothetical protein
MPDQLNANVVDSVAATNFKSLGDGPAFWQNMVMSNAVSHQQRMQTLAEASTGRIAKSIVEPDIAEAASIEKIKTGHDLGSHIASLLSALGGGQQAAKVAQTTPPTMS